MNSKRSSSPKSAAIISGNEDLLIELLSFFPASTLIRFQLVSKQWHSLISAPSFRRLHTLRHCHRKPQPSFILRPTFPSTTSHEFFYFRPTIKKLIPFSFRFPSVKILQSCNGLLLLETKNTQYGRKIYYICNPTTMQYRNVMIGRTSCERLCLVFDPSKSPHYKVIRFMTKGTARPGREYTIDVYESETHTWNNWGKRRLTNWRFNNAVYWNGGMYFIRPGGNSYCFYLQEIAGVDERIDRPPWTCCKGMRQNYAMESNGHLHSISLSVLPDKNYLSVFEMNKEDRSWFMKYRVDINPIAHLFAVKFPVVGSVLGIVRGDREEDSTFLFHEPGKIILYRFYEESFEVLVDFTTEDYYEEGRVQFDFNDVYQFIETLAPV
ncbi:hypothetical protein BUALT_Bualt12G0055000 [Buddleja alternifolia]|uniref:F-box domain-containing protein n=1 Tax=Buddleja alternifolia TaxID=168488 RepID=A0AAV6WW59_9LAMI|nr:hypothetical protein BUALT_Bualt12G0055000 [Buddleja alternifolia]